MNVILLSLILALMLLCLLALIVFLVFVMKETVSDMREDRALEREMRAAAKYDTVMDLDGQPVKLATNYAGLRSMSGRELMRAANYLDSRESYLAKLEQET